MTIADVSSGSPSLPFRWRVFECWAVAAALFYMTGAIVPMMFMDAGGNIDAAGRSKLQLLVLPIYLMTLIILARYPWRLQLAMRRNLMMVALIGLPFLSVAWSISPFISFRRAIGLLLSMLLAYVLAMRFTPRQLLVITASVLGLCMVLSIAMILVSPGLAYMQWEPALRGVFIHKNVLGWYAAMATLATGALVMDRSLGLRPIAAPLLIASLACLLLSKSATSLFTVISAGLFALFYIVLARLGNVSRAFLIVVALQIVAALLIFVDVFLEPLLDEAGKDVSFTGRVPLWSLVDAAIGRRPLFGYGYQAFWTEGNGDAWSIWAAVGWMAPHAHNGYRDAMLSFGLLGTSLLVMVIVGAIRAGAILHCRFPKEGWLWMNVLVCIFPVMNLTESLFLDQNSFLFILFASAVIMFSLREAS